MLHKKYENGVNEYKISTIVDMSNLFSMFRSGVNEYKISTIVDTLACSYKLIYRC